MWTRVASLTCALLMCTHTHASGNDAIQISADSMSLDMDSGVTVYSGNVTFRSGDTSLTGDEISITRQDGADRVVVTGSPARFDQTSPQETVEASSERMEYEAGQGMLILRENASLTQSGREINSDLIRYDTQRRQIIAGDTTSSQPSGRVNIILTDTPAKE